MTQSGALTIEQRVLRYIRRYHLLENGQKVLVAVSGGADSLCLLQVLYRLREELGIRLEVAHLDHCLRGAESQSDACFVQAVAAQLGLPVSLAERDVEEYRVRQRLTLEEAAREVRYAFLAETARSVGADRVAVGHTQNDQVETVLLHIIRGTGSLGLQGLRPSRILANPGPDSQIVPPPVVRPLMVVRPLLEVTRAETEEYCRVLGLTWRRDSSNLSTAALRNRVRLQVLPELAACNPDIAGALLRLSRTAADEAAFLETESAGLWEQITVLKGSNLLIDKNALLVQPPALQRQILRRAFQTLLGSLKDIETRHIETLLSALTRPAGRRVNLPAGLVFSVEYNRYIFGPDPAALIPFPELPGEQFFTVPGESELAGWSVHSQILPYTEFSDDPESPQNWQNDGFTADFDLERSGQELSLRSLRAGDVFQPLGLGQTKKVARFMLDARVPHDWRARVPLVCNPRQVIWVGGWRIDDRVKVTPTTSALLRLRLIRRF